MSEEVRCPDCGRANPPGSDRCQWCNFPIGADPLIPARESDSESISDPSSEEDLASAVPASAPGTDPESERARDSASSSSGPELGAELPGAATPSGVGPPETATPYRPLKPLRPRRPKPAANQALSIWLLFGACCAIAVVYIAVKANVDRAREPIEGASSTQTQRADELRAALEKDSTNVDALIGLANVYYDTANWPDAIVKYRAALRRDSSRVSALVDLGVAYYNTGNSKDAERMFDLALVREPHHPVALFNLGIVTEKRKDYDAALSYFHRSLQSGPPDEMRTPILEAMQRVQEAAKKSPPPLPGN